MDCHDVVGEMMFLSIVDEQLDDILLYWGWRILDSLHGVSLLVPNYTISLCGSSCNILFFVSLSLRFFHIFSYSSSWHSPLRYEHQEEDR